MITVMALDRIDGWLFARDGERIRLLRPPYRLTEAEVVADSVVARAIMHHGYAACARELATWAEVVKHVVQRHGGELQIESDPGKGSRFRLVFPAARVRVRRAAPVLQPGADQASV